MRYHKPYCRKHSHKYFPFWGAYGWEELYIEHRYLNGKTIIVKSKIDWL